MLRTISLRQDTVEIGERKFHIIEMAQKRFEAYSKHLLETSICRAQMNAMLADEEAGNAVDAKKVAELAAAYKQAQLDVFRLILQPADGGPVIDEAWISDNLNARIGEELAAIQSELNDLGKTSSVQTKRPSLEPVLAAAVAPAGST